MKVRFETAVLLLAVTAIAAGAAIDVPPLPDPHADDQIHLGPMLLGGVNRYGFHDWYYDDVSEIKPIAGFGAHFDYNFGQMFYKTHLYGEAVFADPTLVTAEWENGYGFCLTTSKFRPYIMPGAGIRVMGNVNTTQTSFVALMLFGILFKPNPDFSMVLEGGFKGVTSDDSYGLIRNIYDVKFSPSFGFRFGFYIMSELDENAQKLEAAAVLGPNFYF